MNKLLLFFILLRFTTWGYAQQNSGLFNEATASRLSKLPLHCIANEWPNKTSHGSDSATDHRLLPHELHPVFYGCYDWHSSVHGHWMLVKLLKTFPGIAERTQIVALLNKSFQLEKMKAEAAYFSKYKTSALYERTYGWAWLLKLDQELYEWNDPLGRAWHAALQPLTAKVKELWTAYLPKQTYPNRTGVHPNTAFGLVFALDWATALRQEDFAALIRQRSREYYLNNKATPAYLEPDGSDFLSPSLEIADLMTRVLDKKAFAKWFDKFYTKKGIENVLTPPIVSDRTDYQIVHLDGLSLSRAWCLKTVGAYLPQGHRYKAKLLPAAEEMLQKTIPHISSGNYGGDHWLASFAVYAIFN
ncbi:MAG: DUF2891 domain-containing protein [Chitinophagaceae bacterium]|nr:MAG: DUF2891 domain-containing protein [Chitinophagaceae bacterium]